MRWQQSTDGGHLGGAEEEGTMDHVLQGDGGTLGVGDFIVLAVYACNTRWIPCAEEVALPHGRDRWGMCTISHFSHRHQEMDQPSAIGNGVVKAHGEDESAALEASHLRIQRDLDRVQMRRDMQFFNHVALPQLYVVISENSINTH